ncbi:hypothetical protein QEZ54_34440 [Catellatospora sp. KI3]|uniref:hypothetical protein n=1 Tax=Catellatospora sp. KI3 TaxID=3041620 RepID=UPI0024828D50|nr:hypothetical protein [Catellatospora sp. KI3]MDI1466087.1 hypothetical protein [Catellatospora sp. KI3]
MELRPELLPPPVSPERIAELCAEIHRMEDLALSGDRVEAEAAVAAFNEATGHACGLWDFVEYDAERSIEEFALELARPSWPRVPDVTRDELVELVRRIVAGGPDTDYYLLLLDTNTVHPGASSVIFHPPARLPREPSPDQVVDEILSYEPIAL